MLSKLSNQKYDWEELEDERHESSNKNYITRRFKNNKTGQIRAINATIDKFVSTIGKNIDISNVNS